MLVRPLLALVAALALAGCSAPAAPTPEWAPPADPPPAATEAIRPGVSGLVDAAWVERVALATGIPLRTLAAYAGAALNKAAAMPECGLSWNTLAGIGAVESDHGRYGGATIADDGTVSPAIIGIALDGGDTDEITDTDGGAIDGDAVFDRAVGPLQFIPEAWNNWYVDGSGDGVTDPHNIDDAAVAASNYLCRAVRDVGPMSTEDGWKAGIASYNSATSYSEAVAAAGVAAAEGAVEPEPEGTN